MEDWAEIRRLHRSEGLSKAAIAPMHRAPIDDLATPDQGKREEPEPVTASHPAKSDEVQPVVGNSGVIDGPLDEDDSDDSGHEPRPEQPQPDGTAVVVYIPSERIDGAVKPDSRVQLRYLEDGQLALPVFSSLDELVTDCGEGQPWVAIAAQQVEEFRQIVGADLAALDLSIPTDS